MSTVTSVKMLIISAVTRDKLGANGTCTNGNQAYKKKSNSSYNYQSTVLPGPPRSKEPSSKILFKTTITQYRMIHIKKIIRQTVS